MDSREIEFNKHTKNFFIGIEDETEKAYLINLGLNYGDIESYWLPKSQIRISKDKKKVFIPEWLCKEKGLI